MNTQERLVLSEEITHQIMLQFQKDVYRAGDTAFTYQLIEHIEVSIRPIIRRGVQRWIDSNG